jgi:hypothetical protein
VLDVGEVQAGLLGHICGDWGETMQALRPHRSRRLGDEELPRAGYAVELVLAAVGELEAGAGDEVGHGARDECFTGLREGRDLGADLHGDAAEVVAVLFALAGMHADAQLDAERPDRFGRS